MAASIESTDAAIDLAINRYEQAHRLMLTPAARSSLRVLARQQPTAPRVSRHPLGHDAAPTEDQATPENRAAVRSCLRAYWDGSLSDQINQRRDTATGFALADRFVSLLEVGTSLQLLRLDEPGMATLLERRYRDGWTVLQLCQDRHYTPATYYRHETEAVDLLIGAIFFDMEGEKLTSFDENVDNEK